MWSCISFAKTDESYLKISPYSGPLSTSYKLESCLDSKGEDCTSLGPKEWYSSSDFEKLIGGKQEWVPLGFGMKSFIMVALWMTRGPSCLLLIPDNRGFNIVAIGFYLFGKVSYSILGMFGIYITNALFQKTSYASFDARSLSGKIIRAELSDQPFFIPASQEQLKNLDSDLFLFLK